MAKRRSLSIDPPQPVKRYGSESKDRNDPVKESIGGPDKWIDQLDRFVAPIRAAFDLDQRVKAIAESTRVIDELLHRQILLLDIRARTQAKNAEFSAALSDCHFMTEQAPTSAIGYLCTGEICEMQGRQQAAIDVYKRGLTYIPAGRETERRQLEENADRAQAKLARRVDFIVQLPFEILATIVTQFVKGTIPSPTTYRYLNVSRTWRNRIYQSTPNLHFTLDFASEDKYPQLSEPGPYIHALTIRSPYGRLAHSMLSQLVTADFGALRELDFVNNVPRRRPNQRSRYGFSDLDCSTVKPDMLLKAIRKLGPTLTCLRIQCSFVSLGNVLASCPNLETLEFEGTTKDEVDLTNVSDTCKLKSLAVSAGRHNLEEPTLRDILCRCPILETLVVPICKPSDCLETTEKHCPWIRNISLNSRFTVGLEQEAKRLLGRTQGEELAVTRGIELLEISGIPKDKIKQFGLFLARARPTLRGLAIDIVEDDTETADWLPEGKETAEGKGQILFPNLRVFHWRYVKIETERTIASFHGGAPLLERVMFERTKSITRDVLLGLIDSCCLGELEFNDCESVQAEVLQQFLEAETAFPKLERLVLGIDHSLHQQGTLDLVSQVVTLTHLTISGFYGLTKSDFVSFAEKLHELPRLRSLEVKFMHSATDEALPSIAGLGMLEELVLSDLDYITDRAIASLSICTTLKRLTIESCFSVSDQAVQSVKEKLGLV